MLTITTSSDHSKISYRRVLEAQVVLVSAQFLSGTHYNGCRGNGKLKEKHVCRMTHPCVAYVVPCAQWENIDPSLPPMPAHAQCSRPRRSTRSRSKSTARYQDLDQLCVFLELLHWRRIVLDEAPELLCDAKVRDPLFEVRSDFCWYVSATPFPNDAAIGFCADFLEIKMDARYVAWRDKLDQPLGHALHAVLYHQLFSRHTKESILSDNFLPNVADAVQLIAFHPIEQLLYDLVATRANTSKNRNLKRKVCSGVLHAFEREYQQQQHGGDRLRSLLDQNRRYYPRQVRLQQGALEHAREELCEVRKLARELEDKKREFAARGETFTFEAAWRSDRKRDKHRRLGAKTKCVQKRISDLNADIAQLRKEQALVEDADIEPRVRKYEAQFSGADAALLLSVVRKYGAKQVSWILP